MECRSQGKGLEAYQVFGQTPKCNSNEYQMNFKNHGWCPECIVCGKAVKVLNSVMTGC